MIQFLSKLIRINPLSVLIITIIIFVNRWFKNRRKHLLSTFERLAIPGPRPTSILIGNFRQYLQDDRPHQTLDQWTKQYGKVFGYYQGVKPILVLANADDVQRVMSVASASNNNKSSFSNLQRSFVISNVEPFASTLPALRGI